MESPRLSFASPEESSLSEVLDRLLDKGVVIAGDLVISAANIDLVYRGLRVLLASVARYEALLEEQRRRREEPASP